MIKNNSLENIPKSNVSLDLPLAFMGWANKKIVEKKLFALSNEVNQKNIYTIYGYDEEKKIFIKVQPSLYPSNIWPIQCEYIAVELMKSNVWMDKKAAMAQAKKIVDLFFMASQQAYSDQNPPFHFSITQFKTRDNN